MVTIQRELFHLTAKWHLSATWEIISPEVKICEFETHSSLLPDTKSNSSSSKIVLNKLTLWYNHELAKELLNKKLLKNNFCIIIKNGRLRTLIHDFIPISINMDGKTGDSFWAIQGTFESCEELIPFTIETRKSQLQGQYYP